MLRARLASKRLLAEHHPSLQQLRWARSGPPRSRLPTAAAAAAKSEWWAVDGEIHEIGDHVPHRERFVIPRDNIPNRRRKQMREQFMRRTRLPLNDSDHEVWCKRYMELHNELRENWERLYWDEGYSKKVGQDHANYESAEDDDLDFSPYRKRQPHMELNKDQGFGGNRQADTWEKVGQIRDKFEYDRERRMREKGVLIRDKFEYDRERRMREKAFAPMNMTNRSDSHDLSPRVRPFDTEKFFPNSETR